MPSPGKDLASRLSKGEEIFCPELLELCLEKFPDSPNSFLLLCLEAFRSSMQLRTLAVAFLRGANPNAYVLPARSERRVHILFHAAGLLRERVDLCLLEAVVDLAVCAGALLSLGRDEPSEEERNSPWHGETLTLSRALRALGLSGRAPPGGSPLSRWLLEKQDIPERSHEELIRFSMSKLLAERESLSGNLYDCVLEYGTLSCWGSLVRREVPLPWKIRRTLQDTASEDIRELLESTPLQPASATRRRRELLSSLIEPQVPSSGRPSPERPHSRSDSHQRWERLDKVSSDPPPEASPERPHPRSDSYRRGEEFDKVSPASGPSRPGLAASPSSADGSMHPLLAGGVGQDVGGLLPEKLVRLCCEDEKGRVWAFPPNLWEEALERRTNPWTENSLSRDFLERVERTLEPFTELRIDTRPLASREDVRLLLKDHEALFQNTLSWYRRRGYDDPHDRASSGLH